MENLEDKILSLKDHCVFTLMGNEAIFLDAKDKKYHTVNGTAAFILSALSCEHGISFADLKAKIMARYRVNEQTATSQLKEFLGELDRLKFLKASSHTAMERPTIALAGDILGTVAAPIGKLPPRPLRMDPYIALKQLID
jgi:hypothetical protein